MDLISAVQKDIVAYFSQATELCFNERDLQMHLALWLRSSSYGYDDVDIEYYVPYESLGDDYIWNNELRLDLVVRKGDDYLPVELKYKTKSVKKEIKRFGELMPKSVKVMKNQGAQDIGMYSFWKDVRRLELVQERFEKVVGGIALFVTNDQHYLNSNRETSNHYLFGMSNGVHGRKKSWQKEESYCAKHYPAFDVNEEYEIAWTTVPIEGVELHYNMITTI